MIQNSSGNESGRLFERVERRDNNKKIKYAFSKTGLLDIKFGSAFQYVTLIDPRKDQGTNVNG